MKARFITLGCKVNAYETEAVWELLQKRGYERCETGAADVYVVNTCLVTNTAEQKSRQAIRHLFRENKKAAIVVMGCLAELKPDDVDAIEGVVISVGTKDRDKIPDLLQKYFQTRKHVSLGRADALPQAYDNLTINMFSDHQRAFLKIEDGCDNFCSYCIIPYARGRVRSKPRDIVLNEAKTLANNHVEIILTGIHTGGYGRDLNDYAFLDLLQDLEAIPELKRLRISSIEVNELTPEVIESVAKSKKIVHHLHVPLQSGCDKILKLMNRHYDTAAYRDKINNLRDQIHGVSLTTDVIVGFPGETDSDFRDTFDFVKEMGFHELHVFPYSKRSGTLAANLPGEIDGAIKKERARKLIDLGETLAKEAIKAKVGAVLNVIGEREKNGWLQGHSETYIHVRFQGDKSLVGQEAKVRLIKEEYPLSLGEIV